MKGIVGTIYRTLAEAVTRGRFYEPHLVRLRDELGEVAREQRASEQRLQRSLEREHATNLEVLRLRKLLQAESDRRSGAEQRAVDQEREAAKWKHYAEAELEARNAIMGALAPLWTEDDGQRGVGHPPDEVIAASIVKRMVTLRDLVLAWRAQGHRSRWSARTSLALVDFVDDELLTLCPHCRGRSPEASEMALRLDMGDSSGACDTCGNTHYVPIGVTVKERTA